MVPPGMKRLAQTMSQPPRPALPWNRPIAALKSSSAGAGTVNGAVLAAKPDITAPCAPRDAVAHEIDGQGAQGGERDVRRSQRQRVVVLAVVADQHAQRRFHPARQRLQSVRRILAPSLYPG